MKKLIQTIILLGASCAYAQTTNQTFQWHGQTMGIEFETTNLTDSVKSAIRDDIAYSLSLIAASNVTFEVSAPNTNHTGVVSIHYQTPIDYCEGVLCFYKTIGGNVWWQIDSETCSNYLAAITLTNQHATAINSFSNYFHQVKTGFDITGLTFAEKKAFFWGPLVDVFAQEEGDNFEQFISDALTVRPSPLPESMFLPLPSILAFSAWKAKEDDMQPVPVLLCTLKHWNPVNESTKWYFVYAGGKWRYCFMEL
jgi:hypothetical protein